MTKNLLNLMTTLMLLMIPMIGFSQESEELPKYSTSKDALDFLAKMEAKNADLTTLHGTFVQVRKNEMFLEEIKSTGEFWYSKPDKFRCDYNEPTKAIFYLLGDTAMFYTPEIKQVEQVRLEQGDSAPIHQMLVGFGLSLGKITEVFDVKLSDDQPEDSRILSIDFISKDETRTMGFQSIIVQFDQTRLEPMALTIYEGEDLVSIELKETEKNVKIDGEKFEPEFPDDVEIIPYQ